MSVCAPNLEERLPGRIHRCKPPPSARGLRFLRSNDGAFDAGEQADSRAVLGCGAFAYGKKPRRWCVGRTVRRQKAGTARDTVPASSQARAAMTISEPGAPFPFGASITQRGTNFALFSDNADEVELCLFDNHGDRETERLSVTECTDGVWHCHLRGIGRGQVYGWRVHGPWAPEQGYRFNPAKLLLDPYARQLVGDLRWNDALHAYPVGAGEDADLIRDERDSAQFMPKARVVAELLLTATAKPRNHWPKTIIYEGHLRGLTMRHPLVPEDVRGTFAALGSAPMIEHLLKLGITTLELLPVQAFLQDRHLVERGLSQLLGLQHAILLRAGAPLSWGRRPGRDRRCAVERLAASRHRGDPRCRLQPHLRGQPSRPRRCRGAASTTPPTTGCCPANRVTTTTSPACGNSLEYQPPARAADGDGQPAAVGRRVWGRRLPLRSSDHARTPADGFDPPIHVSSRHAARTRYSARQADHAEPWDVGPGGYQLGNFPPGFSEWNGDYRDVVREFWSGRRGALLPTLRDALCCRLERPLRRGPAPAVVERQLRHRARRLHAADRRLLQRTSTTKRMARTAATATTTTAAGTAASRVTPTTPTILALRGPAEAQPT
jgi:hypothetical protein